MRIVQVCPYSWSARGGVQTHVRELSRHLSDRGHDVLVLTAGRVGPRAAGVERIQMGGGTLSGQTSVCMVGSSIRVPFNRSVAPICVQVAGVRAVRRALLEFQPDVVHVHEPLVPGVSLSATWFAQVPVVATFHSHYRPPSLDACLYSLAALCVRPISRRVAVRLAVSRAAASCAASRVGGSVHIVPNGVDIDSFALARPAALPPGRNLLFVGRLDRRKGFDVAVRAFARLCERFEDLRFLVVGAGPCMREAATAPPAVAERILMLGDVDDRHLPSIYAAADVFVAPSSGRESFGTVLLEAMAAGLPIVATNIEGYREVVRAGIDALLVGPRDEVALADAIGRILETPALATGLGLSARSRVEQFAWGVVTDAIERVYSVAVGASVVHRAPTTVPVIDPSL